MGPEPSLAAENVNAGAVLRGVAPVRVRPVTVEGPLLSTVTLIGAVAVPTLPRLSVATTV